MAQHIVAATWPGTSDLTNQTFPGSCPGRALTTGSNDSQTVKPRCRTHTDKSTMHGATLVDNEHSTDDAPAPWQPIPPNERRVLGVLVEKAKTTPGSYPLSLNGLTTGCNQKSNRDPVLTLDGDDVEDALESLRSKKAVAEVHGDGRTVKYRHYMKDWLGVDGTELAVMAELLLRGAQTVGELRGRAARMCKGQLPDMATLRPVLQGLVEKNLVVELTPQGRGQIVTHGLYSESELARVKRDMGSSAAVESDSRPAATVAASSTDNATSPPSENADDSVIAKMQEEIQQLRDDVKELRSELDDLKSS